MNLATFISEEDLQTAIRTTTTFKVAKFLPHVEEAAENFLIPALSEDFLEEIVDGTITDDKVVKLTRHALINFAAATYADTGTLNITSTGIQEFVEQNQKPVRMEVIENFQKSKLTTGHNKLERLLAYLEEKSETVSTFDTWKDSPAYTIRVELPISSVADFQKYVHIRDSRRVFMSLRPAMQRTLSMHIEPVLATSPVDLTGISTENKDKLQALLKPAFAHLSMAYGVNEIAVVMGKYDTILMFENTGVSKMRTYKSATEDRLKVLGDMMLSFGQMYLSQLADFLISLDPPVPDLSSTFENDPDWRVWVA